MALGFTVVTFFARFLLWGLGAAGTRMRAGNVFAFTVAFFAVYAVLMWIEIGFVLTDSKRRSKEARSGP